MADPDDDDDYFLPLEDQRVFGAGIKRKRIKFIPATSTESSLPPTTSTKPTPNPSMPARYLSIVLPKSSSTTPTPDATPTPDTDPNLCTVCNRPLSPTHESTIAHQVCLEHSHPPSHLDRSRHGLRYLSSYGWNPDERAGLGLRADGIRYPVKAAPKYDTVGLREREDEDAVVAAVKKRRDRTNKTTERVKMFDAKEIRKRDLQARKKAEKMRSVFYGNDDVERYMGNG